MRLPVSMSMRMFVSMPMRMFVSMSMRMFVSLFKAWVTALISLPSDESDYECRFASLCPLILADYKT